MIKRLFDCTAAAVGLVLLSPVFLGVALWIRSSSPGPVFFRQLRVGRDFRSFHIWKFRTMHVDAAAGGSITWGGHSDPRITSVGRVLRRTKLDELPQLINVLKGEMSLVGPRPEVREYVELFKDDYREILRVRPGMTDVASLRFRDEASVLAGCADPREAYTTRLLPEKIRLAKDYLRQASFTFDLILIFRTLIGVVGKSASA